MQTLVAFLTFFVISTTIFAANTERRSENAGRYNQQYQDQYYNNRDYYSNRYYKNNRDYYNNRQYYDSRLRNYNPSIAPAQARIVEQDVKTPENGAYTFSYETENGIRADEHGVPVQVGKDEQKEVVEGSYSFTTPEGVHVLVRYTADERGFHPVVTYGGVHAAHVVDAHRAQSADVVVAKSN